MEFLDEESRPKFQFQSRIISSSSSSSPPESQFSKINKPVAFFCVTLSILTLIFTILSIQILPDTVTFILFWFSISFLVGPFAPTSITAGDIRVGQGELLEDPVDLRDESAADEYPKKNRRNKSRRSDENLQPSMVVVGGEEEKKKSEKLGKVSEEVFEEKEWIDGDFDLLKKQIVKFPVGTPRRWEMIAEAFKGRHGVDSVIKMAKSNSDRKQPGSADSFSQFLKQRKPLDKRMEEENGNGEITDNGEVKKDNSNGDGLAWSSAEDIALLNALKAFPKDSAMRWEKIAVAVPGKSKAACMKRVAELKKGFRSSKASTE